MARTILIIEDNGVVREGVALLLRQKGYAAVTAQHGQEALDYLQAEPAPHAILLDMHMPVLDGWGFLEKRKNLDKLTGTPIIIMTSGNTTREWALDHGAVGFVRKPVDIDVLLNEIGRVPAG